MMRNGHNDLESLSADPQLASMPKGTLPLRPMTSREGGYCPESVAPSTRGRELFDANAPRPGIANEFYSPQNRALIVKAVLVALNKGNQPNNQGITADYIPTSLVNESMRMSFEVHGESAANAPGARFGPSESMSYLAPPEKYHGLYKGYGAELHKLNELAARRLKEQIVSERALLTRYQRDLSGAIHVAEYPKLPPVEQSRHQELQFRDFDAISSEPHFSRGWGRGPGFGS